MRRSVLGAIVTALAACAVADASDAPSPAPSPSPVPSDDGGTPATTDASADAGTAGRPDADASAPRCSSAGWCTTRMPMDTAFTFTDVWPFEDSAFATGLPTGDKLRGTIAEYDGSEWKLLSPLYDARVVWGASKDEVWAGGEAYRGTPALKRGLRASGSWAWNPMLPEETVITGIWGSGPGDVYVLTYDPRRAVGQRVYHFDAAGTPSLVFDAALQANGNQGLRIERLVGTSANDVWIVGRRQQCGYLAHKSDAGFVALVDTVPTFGVGCVGLGDELHWRDIPSITWVNAVAVAPGVVDILVSGPSSPQGGRVVRVGRLAEGGFEIEHGAKYGYAPESWIGAPMAVWSSAPGDIWMAGFGVVLRNPDVFSDAGAFSYSSVALGGSFVPKQFNAIRGTSPNNIWLVGDSYAFHKTSL